MRASSAASATCSLALSKSAAAVAGLVHAGVSMVVAASADVVLSLSSTAVLSARGAMPSVSLTASIVSLTCCMPGDDQDGVGVLVGWDGCVLLMYTSICVDKWPSLCGEENHAHSVKKFLSTAQGVGFHIVCWTSQP